MDSKLSSSKKMFSFRTLDLILLELRKHKMQQLRWNFHCLLSYRWTVMLIMQDSLIGSGLEMRFLRDQLHYASKYGKGWVCIRAERPIRQALMFGFCSMKRLRVFLLPLYASPSQGYPTALNSPVPMHFYTWVDRQFESKVYCLKTQHYLPGQGSNSDRSIWRRAH